MRFFQYQDDEKMWTWSLHDHKGRIIAESGQRYEHMGDCGAAIQIVKQSADVPVLQRKPQLSEKEAP